MKRKRVWHRRLEQFLLDVDACYEERHRAVEWARNFGRFKDAYDQAASYDLGFLVDRLRDHELLPYHPHIADEDGPCWCGDRAILRATWPAKDVYAALRKATPGITWRNR